MSVAFRSALEEWEVDAAYELAARTFGPNYFQSAASQRLIRQLEPLRSLKDVIVAVDGKDVIGFVRILDRKLRVGDVALAAGGITSVSVDPRYQGKGHGRTLMEHAIQRHRERRDVFSLAFARRAVDRFYLPLGYLGIGSHPEMRVTVMPRDKRGEAAYPGFQSESIEHYKRAYEETYLTLFLQFERDPSWWQQLPARIEHRIPGAAFLTFRALDEVAGYAIVKDRAVLEMASRRDAQSSVFESLLRSWDGDTVTLALPPAHWAARASRRFNHTMAVRLSWDGGHIARIIDGGALLDALAKWGATPEQLESLRNADFLHHEEALRTLGVLVGVGDGQADPLIDPPAWSSLDEF